MLVQVRVLSRVRKEQFNNFEYLKLFHPVQIELLLSDSNIEAIQLSPKNK